MTNKKRGFSGPEIIALVGIIVGIFFTTLLLAIGALFEKGVRVVLRRKEV